MIKRLLKPVCSLCAGLWFFVLMLKGSKPPQLSSAHIAYLYIFFTSQLGLVV